MLKPILLVFAVFFSCCQTGLASILPIKKDTVKLTYFKKIGPDSAYIFFTNDFKFTESQCAQIVRHTPVDKMGLQTGIYKDYSIHKRLIGIGSYRSGLRHGLFETYYEDGRIRSQGNFSEDIPTGLWNYFEPDGSVKRELDYSEKIVKISSASSNGKRMVKNGNGKFKGSFFSLALNEEMYTSGRIVNGLMEGKWRVRQKDSDHLFSTEYFNNGKFVLGSLSSAGNRFQREYLSKSIITLLEPEYYLLIEKGIVISCDDFKTKSPELIFIDTPAIERLISGNYNQKDALGRTGKTVQIYSLIIDLVGNITNIETIGVHNIYPLKNDLENLIRRSRWKPGEDKSGPVKSKTTLILEFTPYHSTINPKMNNLGVYSVTAKTK